MNTVTKVLRTVGQIGQFLSDHEDLVTAVMDAIDNGADPAALKASVLKAQETASDAALTGEIGPKP